MSRGASVLVSSQPARGAYVACVVAVVVAGATSGCQDELLVFDPGGAAGQVCNPITGRPAAGAALSCDFVNAQSGETGTQTTTADDDGFFTLGGLASGRQTIDVRTPEFTTSLVVEVTARSTAQVVDPACRDLAPPPGTGTIGGQICNRHTGEVVTNAEVIITLADGSQLTTSTDPDTGNFTIDVPTGTAVVRVQSATFRKTYVAEVEDGKTVIVEQSSECAPPDPLTTGFVQGCVCAPDDEGGGPLAGALVTAKWTAGSETVVIEAESGDDGCFILDPISPTPATNVVVNATKGAFAFTWTVPLVANRAENPDGVDLTADLGCQPLVPDDDRHYLVVQGFYDRIEDTLQRNGIVPPRLEFHDGVPTSGLWAEDLFGSVDTLRDYDVIFVNCGVDETEFTLGLSANARRNLRTYVEEGGSLYVSDWAYELVEQTFPEKIDFLGDDREHDAAQHGVGNTYVSRVVDPALREFLVTAGLAGDAITIDFAFQDGSIISSLADGVTTFLETDMQFRTDAADSILEDTPITVGFRHGLGRVIFTSFHQETNPDDGTTEVLDGPEDAVLRYLVFDLDSF